MEPIEFLYLALDLFVFLIFTLLPIAVMLISLAYIYKIVKVVLDRLPSYGGNKGG